MTHLYFYKYSQCLGCLIALLSVGLFAARVADFSSSSSIFGFSTIIFLLSFVGCYAYKSIVAMKNTFCKAIYIFIYIYVCVSLPLIFYAKFATFDTWQYYGISNYIFEDFGYMDMIRQNIVNTHYEMAFPPLTPLLIRITNEVFDLGVMATVYLNVIFLLLSIPLLIKIGKHFLYQGLWAIGCLIYVVSLFPWLAAGNHVILGFFIFLCIACLLLKTPRTSNLLIISILAGLGLMNRFDFLPIALCIALFLPFLYSYRGKLNISKYALNVCICLGCIVFVSLPWIVYSLRHFDSLFITDNGRRLVNIYSTYPNSYFSQEFPAKTINDDFLSWLIAFSRRAGCAVKALAKVPVNSYIIAPVLLACLSLVICRRMFLRNIKHRVYQLCQSLDIKETLVKNGSWIVISVCLVAQSIVIVMTGFPDSRYQLLFVLFFYYFIISRCVGFFQAQLLHSGFNQDQINYLRKISFVFIFLLSLFVASLDAPVRSMITVCAPYPECKHLNQEEEELRICLKEAKSHCCAIPEGVKSIDRPKFMALCKLTTAMLPKNLADNTVESYVKDFNVDHVLLPEGDETKRLFDAHFKLTETSFDRLYKIERKEP